MNKESTIVKTTAKLIRKNNKLLVPKMWKEFFHAIKQDGGSIRFAAHIIHVTTDKHFYLGGQKRDIQKSSFQLKIYSNNVELLEKLKSVEKCDSFEFYNELLCFMKRYHCYVDFTHDSPKDIFENSPQDKTIKILIDKSEKVIAKDTQIQERFEYFSNQLLQKATEPGATLMDIFFMLAYHTIDKIEFKPKNEMTEWVFESLNRVVDKPTEHRNHENDYNKYNRYNYKIEELMGCYIDRSNHNCSLSADNNIIYLCKEYIEEFSSGFDDISYNTMFDLVFTHEFGHLVFSYLDYDNDYNNDILNRTNLKKK